MHDEKLIFLFLNQNICCRYSKELSQCDGSFEHRKFMLKLMDKKLFTFFCSKFCFNLIFFFLFKNICCEYSKELSHFEPPKLVLKLTDKKLFTFLCLKFCFNLIFLFLNQKYVLGTQKNHLNKKVLLSIQNLC